MRFSPSFKRSFRITKFRTDVPRDVEDEIQFHIDSCIQDLVAEGMPPKDAERKVLASFGDRQRVQAECQRLSQQVSGRQRRLEIFSSFFGDLKLAFRDMRKHPAHCLGVSLTLGLALALATAIFTVVYAVVLRPLPFGEPARVVSVFNQHVKSGQDRVANSANDYLRRREMNAFEDVALLTSQTRSIGEPGAIRREFSMRVTPSFFKVLGLQPRLGRFLDEDQIQPGRAPQVVIGADLWQQMFAADPAIVGQRVDVEGEAHTIVGVMPDDFAFPGWDAALWLPLVLDESLPPEAWYSSVFGMVARLNPGITVEQAQAEIDALNIGAIEQLPTKIRTARAQDGYRTQVVGFHHDLTRDVRGWLFLLLAGSFAVLLIAGVSISNLQLVHTSGRLRELSTRFVLGAGHGRLLRQLLTESLALALVGGSLGIAAGAFSLRWWLANFQTWEIPRIDEVGLGAVEILVLLAAALVAMLLASLVGALSVARPDLFTMMRGGSATDSGSHSRWRGFLVAAQVAMAVVLLVGATLMVVSLRNLLAIDLGFETESVSAMAVSLAHDHYVSGDAKISLFNSMLEEVRSLPGVGSVAIASRVPFSQWGETSALTAEGQPRSQGETAARHHRTVISSDFFTTLSIPLKEGRSFNSGDDRSAPPAIIISESVASRYWPGESALGKNLSLDPSAPDAIWLRVVGVAGEIIQEDVTESSLGAYYLPFQQAPRGFMRILIKSKPVPSGFAGSHYSEINQRVAALDPELSLFWVTTLEESVDSSLISFRLPMQFLSIFALIALVLAAIGVFGVLSRSVALRSKEIGIRLALGSSKSQVCGSLIRSLAGFVGCGMITGLIVAVVMSRLIESQVYGVRPNEPWVFLVVATLIALIVLLASAVPAIRASRVDPVKALAAQ